MMRMLLIRNARRLAWLAAERIANEMAVSLSRAPFVPLGMI
jgi:hypothetical protein